MEQSSSTTEFSQLKDLAAQDFGFVSEPLTIHHKDIVVDMISRSFADKGDLTTLANVKYEDIAEQVLSTFEVTLDVNAEKYHFSGGSVMDITTRSQFEHRDQR